MLSSPLNLPKWLEENSHLLKPPINNYCVYNKDVTVMIVGGPNARTDYHINTTAEWFYQYRGSMLLKVVDDAKHRDIPIREGEMFLLPPNTPHNPIRFAHTVGIVLEQPRPADSVDTLRWYCQKCGEIVYEASFHCTDLGTQIKEAVDGFKEDEAKRKCANKEAVAVALVTAAFVTLGVEAIVLPPLLSTVLNEADMLLEPVGAVITIALNSEDITAANELSSLPEVPIPDIPSLEAIDNLTLNREPGERRPTVARHG